MSAPLDEERELVRLFGHDENATIGIDRLAKALEELSRTQAALADERHRCTGIEYDAAKLVEALTAERDRLREALGEAAAEAHARCPGGGPFTTCPHRHCRKSSAAYSLTPAAPAAGKE